jgi:PAS domain S-box-containing protein
LLQKDSSGKPIGFRGIIRDITERRKTEELLKQSEAQYRLLADHMKDQVWLMDLDLKITYVSPSVEKLLGYTTEDVLKLPMYKLLTKKSSRIAMDIFSREMEKASTAPSYKVLLELECCCKDGRFIWIEASFSFIMDENGKPISILGEGREITKRKQIEESLQKSEENFRHSLDNSPLGVRISTLEGETIYANKAVLDMYGYDSIEELKKIPIQDRYTPESYTQFLIRKQKRLLGEFGPTEYEISIVRKNGEIRHLHVFRKEIFWSGKKQSQVIYEDISLRRQAEEKITTILGNLRKSIRTTIQVLGTASEARDPYTAGHQKRVADLARMIATEMGLPQDSIEAIRMAGAIHDIGKISIPSEILCKPTKLTDLEYSLVQAHTQYSYEIMKDVESPWPLANIVYQHHERINGSGYPQGLKGEDILIEARILAVADVVEAMASYRPYRPSLGVQSALTEIEDNAGILYDSKVVKTCLKLFRENRFKLE